MQSVAPIKDHLYLGTVILNMEAWYVGGILDLTTSIKLHFYSDTIDTKVITSETVSSPHYFIIYRYFVNINSV